MSRKNRPVFAADFEFPDRPQIACGMALAPAACSAAAAPACSGRSAPLRGNRSSLRPPC
jgi:hypothetical protein